MPSSGLQDDRVNVSLQKGATLWFELLFCYTGEKVPYFSLAAVVPKALAMQESALLQF